MSEMQQKYIEKMRATNAANMAFFKQVIPVFHEHLTKPENFTVQVDVSVSENLEIEFKLGQQKLPLQEILRTTREAMEGFESGERTRIISMIQQPEALIEYAGSNAYLRDYYMTDLDRRARGDIARAFIEARENQELLPRPDFGKGVIPILIVFGSGYGSHLFELLDRYEVRHLILIDSEPGITILSTWFTDYVALYNNHLRSGKTRFSMIVSRDPEEVVNQLSGVFMVGSDFWPPYFLGGVSVFHSLRDVNLSEQIQKRIVERLWLMYRGWGFFDDEYLSVRHSIANLHDKRRIAKLEKPLDEKAFAFVIANGPSLDQLIELVRAHEQKALIISCGSALSALERYGIVPDFHIEIERPYLTAETMHYTVSPEFLAKVRVVGPTLLHPEVFDGAAEGLLVTKLTDVAGDCCPPEWMRVQTFPNVANGAVSFLLQLGVRNIALVGIDLGAKDPEHHHSSRSFYFEGTGEAASAYVEQIEEAKRDSAQMPIEVPGNFGGTVRTNQLLAMGLSWLEQDIARYPQAKLWNLSDGVLIKGIEPVRPENFVFPGDVPAKAAMVENVLANFAQRDEFTAHDLHRFINGIVHTLRDGLKTVLERPCATKLEVFQKLADFTQEWNKLSRSASGAGVMLRGSLLHFPHLIYDWMSVMSDETAAAAFSDKACLRIQGFLDDVVREFDAIDPNAPLPEVPAQKKAQEEGKA
ncbi:MAG: DUF115 domain-containing protein [Betaproteobacteria bacterium]|nr:DUF115 domain-containing protein [Betaproteobacteria bacterium]